MTHAEAVASLAVLVRIRSRLQAGEPLRLLIGLGAAAAEIGLSDEYLDGIRSDVAKSIEFRMGECRKALGGEA